MNKWVIRKKSGNVDLLCETMGVPKITARVLLNRGLTSEKMVDDFLNTSLSRLNDFKTVFGLKEAIDIVTDALSKNELITIYGDYDVDGVTSTTILYKTLKSVTDNVNYFLPDREKDGYGLNVKSIDMLIENGTKLIITCDNGIASLVENDYIQKQGIRHIVIDHHEEPEHISENLLKPNAIIDPKQSVCKYPFKEMCAAGLSYRFSLELLSTLNKKVDFLDELLVFATVGTVCDIVPLKSDNRIIVKEGLEIFNKNKEINDGLNAILYNKGILDKPITTYTLGFIIGPTINASGRLSLAKNAVDLFTTNDINLVLEISKMLHELNTKRQELTKEASEELIELVENEKIFDDKVIVLYSNKCEEAVSGIVCGRIKDRYNKPSIVVTKSNGILKGSCRSIESYDMFKELSKVSNYFIKFGGHKMACGFSIKEEDFENFKEELLYNCKLEEEDYLKILAVDEILPLGAITFREAKHLEILKPYGQGNDEPLFSTLKAKVSKVRLIEDKNTLILTFTDETGDIEINAITFSHIDKFKNIVNAIFEPYIANKIFNGVLRDIDLILDIVYYISINEFNGRESVQLKIVDFRPSAIK